MRLEWLGLQDFRNIPAASLRFGPGLNLITGDNGQGKSNLLEAVGLLATGRSFRRAASGVMRRWEQPRFKVSATVETGGLNRSLEVLGEPGHQVFRLDGKPMASVSRMERVLVAVLITPETPMLVRGGPAERRAFLDWVIFCADRRHGGESREYQLAMRSRQRLLSLPGRDQRELEAWESQLALLGARIAGRRHRAVRHLERMLPRFLDGLGLPPEACAMTLSGDLETFFAQGERIETVAARLQEKLRVCRERDRQQGTTGAGPQRDELLLRLQGHPVARFGSRGQQKRFAYALKLAEAGWLEELLGEPPVMVLDDPVAELDQAGAHGLMALMSGQKGRQVFVAAREAGEIPWPQDASLVVHPVVAGVFQVSMEQTDS
ncbi:MAG: DNA replication and repair protein RecF [Magnetococcales bacterium]|nr:DNA replication and repair protein RecF [Magnetococcales bacterium]